MAALLFAFPLPTTLLDAQAQHSASRLNAPLVLSTESNASITSTKSALSVVTTYPDLRTAALFRAYFQLVNGDGLLPDLVSLHVAFLQVLSHVSSSANITSRFQDLDVAVLLSWRALSVASHLSNTELFARLDEDEEVLLLECALSVAQRYRCFQGAARGGVFDLHPEVSSILRHLIPTALGGVPDGSALGGVEGKFWLRFQDESLQLRAVWASVAASRLFGVDELSGMGSDSTPLALLSILLQQLTAFEPCFSVWLPHVSDNKLRIISQSTCRDLLDGIQYEAEARDLVGSYSATKAWVLDVLAQIRLGERLQSLLGFQQSIVSGDAAGGRDEGTDTPPSIPLLLLEASRKLKDVSLWLEIADVLLGAAVSTVGVADGMVSGPWMADLLESLLTNKPAAPHSAEPTSKLDITRITNSISVLLYVNGAGDVSTGETQSIVTGCVRLYEQIARWDNHPTNRTTFAHVFMQVLIHQTWCASSADQNESALPELWHRLEAMVDRNELVLSTLSPCAWRCLTRMAVEMWEVWDCTMSQTFRQAVLSVFLRLVEHTPCLTVAHQGEVYVHCHFEILDNSLHEQDQSITSTGKKRKRESFRTSSASTQYSRLSRLLRHALEQLVFDAAFETNFVQRLQREIIFVLGQVYFYSFGFPMVPLDSADDEDSDGGEGSRSQFNGSDPALLNTLYKYCNVCIKGGWVNKAEIRASLLMLSKADAFRSCLCFPATAAVLEHMFAVSGSPTETATSLLSALQAAASESADEVLDGDAALIRAVGSELFFALLQLGLPPSSEVGEAFLSDPAESASTTLAAVCDLGLFLKDTNQGVIVELCLMDIAFNPFRYFSWNVLLMQYMEAFNAVTDELQKLLLPCRIPSACYHSLLPEYFVLIRPPVGDNSGVCLWKPWTATSSSDATQLFECAVKGLQAASQCELETIFSDSFSSETFVNLHRTEDPLDYEIHLRKLAHLISIRNALFAVFERLSLFVDVAMKCESLTISEEGDERTSWQWQAEMAVLVLSNAAKCYPKGASERNTLQRNSLSVLKKG